MKISRMRAKYGSDPCDIFVSQIMMNPYCCDDIPRWGWWYCVNGGCLATFVTRRPRSGRQLRGLPQHDVFNSLKPIRCKDRFAELIREHRL